MASIVASYHQLAQRDDPASLLSAIETLPPYTTPSLTTNLVCRVLFSILSNLACMVPLRLLCRNSEFAAAVFIVNVQLANLRTILNALIWRNDNAASWWLGYGFCDVDAFIENLTFGLYSTCLLAIVRNLAIQVGHLRAHPLTGREKRRRNVVQALIMFPLPIIQLAFVYPLAEQRYWIGTLVGCNWSPYPSWPYVVFFVIAPVVAALITAFYAVLIYIRFREVSKTTQSALAANRAAHLRNQRTRRRLYLMVISILIPFLPIVVALAVANLKGMGTILPFNYAVIHSDRQGTPWNTITLRTSATVGFLAMNNCYISIVSAVPIFVFFGMTKDAMNSYRVLLLSVGLGRVFPGLCTEYDPDRSSINSSHSSGSSCNPGSSYNSGSSHNSGSSYDSGSSHNPGSFSAPERSKGKAPQHVSFSRPLNNDTSSSTNITRQEVERQPLASSATTRTKMPARMMGRMAKIRTPKYVDCATQTDRQPCSQKYSNRSTFILPLRNPLVTRTRASFPLPIRLAQLRISADDDDNDG